MRRDLSEVGRGGWAGPLAPWSPQGWVYGVSCPATPPHQIHSPTAAFDVDVDVDVDVQRLPGRRPGQQTLPVVVQGAARQEHPRAGDLQDVDLIFGLGQRRERLRQLHYP